MADRHPGATGALVAVAVVSWNTRELLHRCLASLEPERRRGRAEVWVVDNASDDGSAAMVADEYPDVRLVVSETNLGFGPAVNLVARRTTTPWLAPANADVALEPGTLDALLAAAEGDPGAGAIAPRLVRPDDSTQHSVHPFPTLPLTLAFNLGVPRLHAGLRDHLMLEGHWNPERARRVGWALGAFLLVRREAWEAAGGFDDEQWMYAEDLDLGWRLRRAGWRTRYEPSARVRHHESAATAQRWGDERTERWVWSTYAWMLRRRGAVRTRAVAAVNVGGAAVRWAAFRVADGAPTSRFAERRAASAAWARLHRAGLAPRSRLERHR